MIWRINLRNSKLTYYGCRNEILSQNNIALDLFKHNSHHFKRPKVSRWVAEHSAALSSIHSPRIQFAYASARSRESWCSSKSIIFSITSSSLESAHESWKSSTQSHRLPCQWHFKHCQCSFWVTVRYWNECSISFHDLPQSTEMYATLTKQAPIVAL
jgi:hypothetical protein